MLKFVHNALRLARSKTFPEYYRWKSGAMFYGLYLVSRFPSQCLRHFVYRRLGMRIGAQSVVYGRVEIRSPKGIVIGENSSIGHDTILDGRGGLTIGNCVNLSSGVWIWTVEHDVNDPDFRASSSPVKIGDYAWISGRAIIMPGVEVGEGSVVASGAVVTKNVAPYVIVGGVPARVIGNRAKGLRYKLSSCFPFA